MSSWFILTIISIVVLASAEIAQKIALTRKDDISAEANNFVVWLIQGVMALGYLLFVGPQSLPIFSVSLLFQLLILGSVYFWAGTLYYSSYKNGSVSINSVLVSSSIIVSTVLGIIFFGESISLLKFVGSLIIIGAIIYLNYEKGSKWNKANNYALAGAGLYGVGFTLDKAFSLSLTPHIYQILFAFSIGLTGLIYRKSQIISDLKKVEFNTLKVMSISALTFFIWNKLNFVAYSIGGEVGRIDSINNSVIFLIIIMEFFFLKDRSNLKKKIIAATIAMSGVTILGLIN